MNPVNVSAAKTRRLVLMLVYRTMRSWHRVAFLPWHLRPPNAEPRTPASSIPRMPVEALLDLGHQSTKKKKKNVDLNPLALESSESSVPLLIFPLPFRCTIIATVSS